jgi:type II restriction enzyme
MKRPRKSLVDGAYASLIARINSSSAPTLCLLERNASWQVQSLTAIHSSFLTPWVIERRPPLAAHAKRAGWIGCNIRLDRIPPDGELAIIERGILHEKAGIRKRFQRFLPLADLSAEQRGWTTLTLAIIRKLGRQGFTLSELYDREEQFAAIYPKNHHICAKIRQQLQVLRDLGVLKFEGRGSYSFIT